MWCWYGDGKTIVWYWYGVTLVMEWRCKVLARCWYRDNMVWYWYGDTTVMEWQCKVLARVGMVVVSCWYGDSWLLVWILWWYGDGTCIPVLLKKYIVDLTLSWFILIAYLSLFRKVKGTSGTVFPENRKAAHPNAPIKPRMCIGNTWSSWYTCHSHFRDNWVVWNFFTEVGNPSHPIKINLYSS